MLKTILRLARGWRTAAKSPLAIAPRTTLALSERQRVEVPARRKVNFQGLTPTPYQCTPGVHWWSIKRWIVWSPISARGWRVGVRREQRRKIQSKLTPPDG